MQAVDTGNWWTRPCGGRDVVRLALPLVISTISWTVMNFIDRMFLLWYSLPAMAAAMPAGMLHFAMLCFPLGVASYVTTFVAQYHGAGRPERIGLAVWQAVRVGLYATPLFLVTIPLAPHVFSLAGHEPEMVAMEVVYYQVLALGAGGTIIAAGLSAFFIGRGATRVVMVVDTAAALLNVALDYAWIFGRWGFPAMGIEGAAWATVAAQWVKVLVYWWLMTRPAHRATYHLDTGRRFDAALMRRLFRYGGPNGLQLVVEISAFTLFILIVGRLGASATAATTLAFNVNAVAFVPILGLGMAVSTMVGQQLGRNHPDLAARATWTSFTVAAVYTFPLAALFVLAPDLLLLGHASGAGAEFVGIRASAVVLLRFVAAYCVLDAAAIVFVSAIKGAGDTRFVLITTLITSPPPVLVGWWGVVYGGFGIIACWWVITVWIGTMGFIYLARFLQGRWRTMRVIEPDLLDVDLVGQDTHAPQAPEAEEVLADRA